MPEIKELVKSLADKYGRTRESLIPILQGVVQDQRYISDEAMTEIARELDIAAAQVYGTATFYSFLDTTPRGKYVIRVCRTITCSMKGKNQIVQEIEDLLKIKVGETTQNRKFSLLETNCLGWCHKGPAMLINDEVYTELTPEKVREIISEYIKK
ncbi:MAG TPA: NADH-quinone oxidoreductase subunit NuoE [Tenuifilaceae bacterium]|nr:NADH-quinone oxidoreductase subunit NuoE [Tenuifilaceae bacterium]HPE18506.1 NADH-quinone oxidoreductase subunit NuoE [Tenuifilaceae bacterium]HPJ46188.1 NADH-quinone oxidoreductase subunit NuoE [Tenuifilaceae bacterium]HPQ34783.1 NADH-quinone oxidoreductase subunit NuoE [Tenuifilaceae bacterium]HRX68137.1 NADH-quinone oxidoreductase subunit NuoE [Tenuifilaceae bacterium]